MRNNYGVSASKNRPFPLIQFMIQIKELVLIYLLPVGDIAAVANILN
jgi:hypothetical protein